MFTVCRVTLLCVGADFQCVPLCTCSSGESTSACTAARAVGSRVRSRAEEKREGGLRKVTSGVDVLIAAVLYLSIPFRLTIYVSRF